MKKDNETRKKIDLNSDMGESFGRYKLGFDEPLYVLHDAFVQHE